MTTEEIIRFIKDSPNHYALQNNGKVLSEIPVGSTEKYIPVVFVSNLNRFFYIKVNSMGEISVDYSSEVDITY